MGQRTVDIRNNPQSKGCKMEDPDFFSSSEDRLPM
jgi:hypothetical protein